MHKQSDFPVDVKDDENDDKEEENYTKPTHFDNEEVEEDKEEKGTKEDKEDDEENDPMKIAPTVIASLPHSATKLAATSSSEIASTSLIVTTTGISNIQSLFTPS